MAIQKKIYTPKRRGQWHIEVEGEDNDAHIHAFGNVPRDVKKSVELKENCGLRNTFRGLCMIATLLTE